MSAAPVDLFNVCQWVVHHPNDWYERATRDLDPEDEACRKWVRAELVRWIRTGLVQALPNGRWAWVGPSPALMASPLRKLPEGIDFL